jgi:hypothetical protein
MTVATVSSRLLWERVLALARRIMAGMAAGATAAVEMIVVAAEWACEFIMASQEMKAINEIVRA